MTKTKQPAVDISIIIPAKNEGQTIGEVLKGIFDLDLEYSVEVIVVDDGSIDDTAEQAINRGALVVTNPYSKGNGAAIKAGVRQSQGSVLVFMDADGQHDPTDIPRLVEGVNSGYDLVVGSRSWKSQANVGRGLANIIYNRLATFMTGHKVRDLTSGFRAAKAAQFKRFLYLLPNGFSYPTTSTMAFFRDGYSVKYVNISVRKRNGRSHINLLKDGLRFFIVIFKVGTLYSPLKIFVPLSFFFMLSGVLRYIYTYIQDGQFTNMSALLMSVGVLVFLVGLVSEQITTLIYQSVERKD